MMRHPVDETSVSFFFLPFFPSFGPRQRRVGSLRTGGSSGGLQRSFFFFSFFLFLLPSQLAGGHREIEEGERLIGCPVRRFPLLLFFPSWVGGVFMM